MTQEFHLSLTPVGLDTYLIRTELVAPGVPLAEEQAVLPVDEWLQQARQLLDDPLSSLLAQEPANTPALSQLLAASWGGQEVTGLSLNLVSLGQQLYEALFQGTIRDSWMTAQGIAAHRGEELRLRLALKSRRLSRLPWEVLHAGHRPVATGTDIVFSRYQPSLSANVAPQLITEPLRILMAIAAPTDQATLELEREAQYLQTELQQATPGTPQIQLTILSQPDREQLAQALEHRQYQVFHYAGHSDLGSLGGEIYLVSGRTGLTERLSGDDLAGLLANNGIRVAVFNSCRGADGATADFTEEGGARNLAETLVKRGVPAVLAMAERIPDRVALTLSQLFYRNIKQGYPVDLSLNRARAGLIAAYGSHQLYWALPILYLQPEFDGYLQPEQRVTPTDAELSRNLSEVELESDLFPLGTNLKRHLPPPPQTTTSDSSLNLVLRHQPQIAKPAESNSPANASSNLPLPPSRLRNLGSTWRWWLLVTVVFVGVGAAFIQFLLSSSSSWQTVLKPSPQPVPTLSPSGNAGGNAAEATTAQAIAAFRQGDVQTGVQAVEELLDNGVLTFADTALEAVPANRQDDPEIGFLRGRLQWQALQTGDRKYSIDDVRRSWETVATQHNEPKFYTALGFAYYAEGSQSYLQGEVDRAQRAWKLADQTWQTAIALFQQTPNAPQNQVLNAYAGLALVRWKSAQLQGEDQTDLTNQAIDLYHYVIDRDPVNFQPDALAKHNWLWTEEFLRDWYELSLF